MSDNKTPKFLTTLHDVEGNALVFTLGNGKSLRFEMSQCPAEMDAHAKVHGYKQKISDTTARFSKAKDFTGAFADMADVVQSLYNNSWNRGRESTGQSKMELLAAAIARIKKVTVEKAAAAIQKAGEEQIAGWMKNAAVKKAMAEIVAERLNAAAEDAEELDDLNLDGEEA